MAFERQLFLGSEHGYLEEPSWSVPNLVPTLQPHLLPFQVAGQKHRYVVEGFPQGRKHIHAKWLATEF